MTKAWRWLPFGSRTRLAVQLIATLSLAMLPLGLISVFQTSKVLDESKSLSATALLQRTQAAASGERQLIQSAIGAADSLAASAKVLISDLDLCDRMLSQIVATEQKYVLASIFDIEGMPICSSEWARGTSAEQLRFSDPEKNRLRRILTRPVKMLNGALALSVSSPIYYDDAFQGSVWVSMPYDLANRVLAAQHSGADLVVFDSDGAILATEAFAEDRRRVLPRGKTLEQLAAGGERTFRDTNHAGVQRDFAVVPIIETQVYVLGSWEPRQSGMLPGPSRSLALYFPLLMWLVGMIVAYFGINQLVIRHIRRLQQWMRLYSAGRLDFDDARLDNAPEEIEIVAESFRRMTRRLTDNEQRREEDLAEKTVLLKEVHHRVKNNLQLISSIMNLQIRTARSAEARNLLRRVQDRVMALAAIHRYLYTARRLSMVRADQLLEDIIQQMVIVGAMNDAEHHVNISSHFSDVTITPEQSVPLSLLATEAAMNAVKYCGRSDPDTSPWIQIVLKDLGEGKLTLSVVNSRRPQDADPAADAGEPGEPESGLGSRLIESFVRQLDGTLEINDLPDRFELHVTFAVAPDAAEDDEQEPPIR